VFISLIGVWLRALCLPGRLPRLGGDLWGFRRASPTREFLQQGREAPMRRAAWRSKGSEAGRKALH
jgi:hypothetical protein